MKEGKPAAIKVAGCESATLQTGEDEAKNDAKLPTAPPVPLSVLPLESKRAKRRKKKLKEDRKSRGLQGFLNSF